jgi:hypothetical protein
MNCKHCGNEIITGDVCQDCIGMMQQQPMSSIEATPRKKSKMGLIALGGVLLVGLLGGTGYAAYNYLDIFKSTKQIYFEAEMDSFQGAYTKLKTEMKTGYEKKVKPFVEGSVKTQNEISVDMDLDNMMGMDPSMAPTYEDLLKICLYSMMWNKMQKKKFKMSTC